GGDLDAGHGVEDEPDARGQDLPVRHRRAVTAGGPLVQPDALDEVGTGSDEGDAQCGRRAQTVRSDDSGVAAADDYRAVDGGHGAHSWCVVGRWTFCPWDTAGAGGVTAAFRPGTGRTRLARMEGRQAPPGRWWGGELDV